MSMFKLSLAAVALTAVSAPAFAGSLAPVAAEPVVQAPVAVIAPVAAPSADWTGFYAGAQLGYGQFHGSQNGSDTDDVEGATYGLHAGYLHDFGSWVLGGELSYDVTDINGDDIGVDIEGDGILALKARLGYDAGAFLPYATLGVAQLTTSGVIDDSDTGYLYGVGADYQITSNVRVGAELTKHVFEDFADTGVDIEGANLGLRVSFAF